MSKTLFKNKVAGIACCVLLYLLAPLCTAAGQSAEDTATWLETKLKTTETMGSVDLSVNAKGISFTVSGRSSALQWKDLVTTHFNPTPASTQPADCEHGCTLASLLLVTSEKGRTNYVLPTPGASESDGARIVKAVQHLAALNGAKIVDENLF